MPGFITEINKTPSDFKITDNNPRLINERKAGDSYIIQHSTLDKFLSDKPFYENEKYILLVEGVVLNSRDIILQFKAESFAAAIISCYESKGEQFFNIFRGSFSGLFYDKRKDLWLIYTSHIGDKQIFYFLHNDRFIFGSEMDFLVNYAKHNEISLSLNVTAAYLLLTYGFLIEKHTITNEVKKLTAGHYLKFSNNTYEVIQYHRFLNEPDYGKSYNECIEGIDYHFRNAVNLQFEKDLEYGYKHIATLSGGLDSRMTVWVAHELGYIDQLNTTFSQTNYHDEIIAKQISSDLKHDWLFKSLDHGNFLKSIDEITKITYGGATYYGIAHGKSMFDLIDFDAMGIIHTGQIGDSIIGTFFTRPDNNLKYKIGDGAYSLRLIERLKDYKYSDQYDNQEIFSLYTRAFTGANQGLLDFQEISESVSPFCDVEFTSFCYSIPVDFRFNHKIYFDWIIKKYPGAADYVWEKIGRKITDKERFVNIFGRKIPQDQFFRTLFNKFRNRIGIKGRTQDSLLAQNSVSMNPLDYWYSTNKSLRDYLDSYFSTHIELLSNKLLRDDCILLYNEGNVSEKIQVLTLLSAVKKIHS